MQARVEIHLRDRDEGRHHGQSETAEADDCPAGNPKLYKGSYAVSCNRPFDTRTTPDGQDWLFSAEFPMIQFLERNGYDVTYTSGMEWAYPRAEETPVQSAPKPEAAPVGAVGLHFVRLLGFEGADNEPAPGRNLWARVALPDGTTRVLQFMDSSLRENCIQKIQLAIHKKGDRLTLDFRGTAPQFMNRSVNTNIAAMNAYRNSSFYRA